MFRKTLVSDAARELEKSKMARFDEKSGNLYVTELGRVASHFYIKHSSIVMYNDLLKRHMSEAEVRMTGFHGLRAHLLKWVVIRYSRPCMGLSIKLACVACVVPVMHHALC